MTRASDPDGRVDPTDDARTAGSGEGGPVDPEGEGGPGGSTSADHGAGADDDEREWRFAVEDVGPDGVTEDTSTPRDEPIEPGEVDLEHAAFVVLGVAITVGTLVLGF
ncbi:DUF7312 domain-containing protein [Halorubrum vacuolatum]|uniref:DUF7312 domain-containing protein n=1 Tax=Halorubrum vacuolatum TaxID=63740 RepID=A0A238VMD7_HALVU|nr:hypothetical protein [Halorubrum vacuolatum]SNR35396.1 hypothetical protein SAMN06264855_103119 [Halorubrum vacuolatum]